MTKQQNYSKKIMSHETIYKIMQWLPIAVASIFLIKNIISGNMTAVLVIGLCLVIFLGLSFVCKIRNASLYVKELVLVVALPIFVCIISMNSGAAYSDDFILYIAVMGLTGLLLEPKFTKIQTIIIEVILVILYIAHPEKTEGLSQYILCVACFTLAAIMMIFVIGRGRSFIEVSEERARESEKLLDSVRTMGVELQQDFASSSAKIESSTKGLQEGSAAITRGAGEVTDSCIVVHDKIKEAENQIDRLNNEVRTFELALGENRKNVGILNEQMSYVSDIMNESGVVFNAMEEQMHEIVGIARQINDISFRLTILSLNASVEAANAGAAGAGFDVLASEMRSLSEISTGFSTQVSEAIDKLLEKVEKTSERISGSEEAFARSEETMSELVGSIEKLNRQFESLYGNIEEQNNSISQIDYIFDNLNQRVLDMHQNSRENQGAVESIVVAMKNYKDDVNKIVQNTQSV